MMWVMQKTYVPQETMLIFWLDQMIKKHIQTKSLTQMKDTMQFYADFYECRPQNLFFC